MYPLGTMQLRWTLCFEAGTHGSHTAKRQIRTKNHLKNETDNNKFSSAESGVISMDPVWLEGKRQLPFENAIAPGVSIVNVNAKASGPAEST